MKSVKKEQLTEKVEITKNEMSLLQEGGKRCLVCRRALELLEKTREGAFIEKEAHQKLGLRDHFKYQRKISRRLLATSTAAAEDGQRSAARQ
jgi:hypothetical protein